MQVNIDTLMERLNQNKIYLIQKQQEYDYKINNMKALNKDLAIQYNELFDKGKNIYNAFFELFYQVRTRAFLSC
jgi:ribosome assembly protein YihI (activator of Der GTPase)